MADKRITELNALTISASGDEALISDTSASETKKITLANVFNKVPTWLGFADTVTTMAADALAVPVTASICHKTSGADAEALTIVAGTSGQILIIVMIVDGGGTATVTPTTFANGTTIAFDAVGESVTLVWNSTVGWVASSVNGATVS